MEAVKPMVPEVGMLVLLYRIEMISSEHFAKGLSGLVVTAIVLSAFFFATLAAQIVALVRPEIDTTYTFRFLTIDGLKTISIGWQHTTLYPDMYLVTNDATYESPEPVMTQSSNLDRGGGNSNFSRSANW
jgi:hypothetical protein